MRCKLHIIFILFICLFCGYANANNCLIRDDAINGISIGDPLKKLFSTFGDKYKVIEENKPHFARMFILLVKNKLMAKFSVDSDNRIFLIEAYDNCVTPENIGVGSALQEAIKKYGKGSLTPTDEGYLIYFENVKRLAFLLDSQDIPKRLRNIPDDIFTRKQEAEILELNDVTIKSIKIYGP